MDSTSAEPTSGSPPTSSSNRSTRRSALSTRCWDLRVRRSPISRPLNSINTNPITGANLIEPINTEYGIVTDNTAVMVAAKYALESVQVLWRLRTYPADQPVEPLGVGATAQGGYLLSGVEDNNLDSPKTVQVYWTGVKYSYDSKTELTLSYYRETAERLPDSLDLLTLGRFPQFLRRQPQRGVVLRGSSLHQTLRRLRRHCLFQCQRRPGHRHSPRSRGALLRRQQPCSDGGCSLRVLRRYREGLNTGPPLYVKYTLCCAFDT